MFAPRSTIGATIAFTATLLTGCQSDSVVTAPHDLSPNGFAPTELSAAAPQLLWNELTPVTGVLIGTPAGAVITPANDFFVRQPRPSLGPSTGGDGLRI